MLRKSSWMGVAVDSGKTYMIALTWWMPNRWPAVCVAAAMRCSLTEIVQSWAAQKKTELELVEPHSS